MEAWEARARPGGHGPHGKEQRSPRRSGTRRKLMTTEELREGAFEPYEADPSSAYEDKVVV